MSIAPRTGRKTAGDWSAKSGGRRAWFSGVAMGCTCNQRRTQCRSIAHLECRSTFPWPCSRGGQSWAAHAQEAPLCPRAAVCRPEPAPVSNSAGCAQRTEARAGPDHQLSATPNNNNKRNKNRPTVRSRSERSGAVVCPCNGDRCPAPLPPRHANFGRWWVQQRAQRRSGLYAPPRTKTGVTSKASDTGAFQMSSFERRPAQQPPSIRGRS